MIKGIMGTPASGMSYQSLNGIYKKSNNCHPKGGRMMLFIPKPQTILTTLGMAHITTNSCDIFEPYHTSKWSRFQDLELPCFPVNFHGHLKDFWKQKIDCQKSARNEDYYSNTSNLSQNETFPPLSTLSNNGYSHA